MASLIKRENAKYLSDKSGYSTKQKTNILTRFSKHPKMFTRQKKCGEMICFNKS